MGGGEIDSYSELLDYRNELDPLEDDAEYGQLHGLEAKDLAVDEVELLLDNGEADPVEYLLDVRQALEDEDYLDVETLRDLDTNLGLAKLRHKEQEELSAYSDEEGKKHGRKYFWATTGLLASLPHIDSAVKLLQGEIDFNFGLVESLWAGMGMIFGYQMGLAKYHTFVDNEFTAVNCQLTQLEEKLFGHPVYPP